MFMVPHIPRTSIQVVIRLSYFLSSTNTLGQKPVVGCQQHFILLIQLFFCDKPEPGCLQHLVFLGTHSSKYQFNHFLPSTNRLGYKLVLGCLHHHVFPGDQLSMYWRDSTLLYCSDLTWINWYFQPDIGTAHTVRAMRVRKLPQHIDKVLRVNMQYRNWWLPTPQVGRLTTWPDRLPLWSSCA